MKKTAFERSNSHPAFYIAVITAFALLLRLMIAMTHSNYFDLGAFNIPWAVGAHGNVLEMYSVLSNLDYPPLFPSLLSIFGGLIEQAKADGLWQMEMLWVKLVPVLFDTALVVVIFLISLRYSLLTAVFLSSVWAVNGAAIINCACWGQTDSMMLLILLLLFQAFEKGMPVTACLLFALGCLTKLQVAYFAPVLLCELFFKYPLRRSFTALGAGLGLGIAGWLPFMLGSRDWILPFRIYFGGFGTYSFINVNAYNVYGIGGNNWAEDSREWLFGIPYSALSTAITVIILVLLVLAYLYAKKNRRQIPAAVHGLFLMNSIFMFTCRMHERYQLPAVILALLAYLYCRQRQYLYLFLGLCLITFCNQAFLLFSMNYQGVFASFFNRSQGVFSVINLVLYGYLAFLYCRSLFWADEGLSVYS